MKHGLVASIFVLLTTAPAAAFVEWRTSEVQFQYGLLENPFTGRNEHTPILTLQNAMGWTYGESFFFADFIEDTHDDGFNDNDIYGEFYVYFSLGKITKKDFSIGPIKDFSIITGINGGADPKVIKFLPGLRASWDLPGFAFLNTDFTAYIDYSRGVVHGGAPKESDSFLFDVNWAYPFTIKGLSFSIEGHAEYAHCRTNEFGGPVESWYFTQTQFRLDLGKLVTGHADRLFIGMEYQHWDNKLGTRDNESVPQFLLAGRF